MGYPQWKTPAGDLGKVAELEFYDFFLEAVDPDAPLDPAGVSYELVAGRFPPGIQLDPLGNLTGLPVNDQINFGGVPAAVSQDTSYKFCIRARSTRRTTDISDRTFSMTITGNNPTFLATGAGSTPPVLLGSFLDGEQVNIALEAIDADSPNLTWSLIAGELPIGLSLDTTTGAITGTVIPFVDLPEGADTGWERSRWEEYPWEFETRSVNKNYNFSVEVTDGKSVDSRKYYIKIYSHDKVTADSTAIFADSTRFTADSVKRRNPVLLTQNLGSYKIYKSDNYFSFKFDVVGAQNVSGYSVDLDSDRVEFELITGGLYSIPPGLTIDANTGWLTGYIASQVAPTRDYTFGVQIYKVNYPEYTSNITYFTLTVLGSKDLDITWITDSDIGAIPAGEVSKIAIEAVSASKQTMTYSLKSGSKLPRGLKMLSDGNISGRCSFQSFSLDQGATTFDLTLNDRGFLLGKTTIDKTYSFTVIATTSTADASSERDFIIAVDIITPQPYENVYVKCLPKLTDRDKITAIVDNSGIFPLESIFRPNDPYWGKKYDVTMLGAYGLSASSAAAYIEAMMDRHYDKRYFFGNYGTSVARDLSDNIIYEVIWVELVEETRAYVKGVGQGPPAGSIDLRKKILNWKNPGFSPNDPQGYTLKINDQSLMRRDLVNNLGITNSTALPDWMSSVQKDGTVTGYVTRAPLAYVKPGEGEKVLFRLNRAASESTIPNIRTVPFQVDRYLLDNTLSQYFDADTQKFVEHHYTTFDLLPVFAPESTPTVEVDFAVDIPFNRINGRSVAFVEQNGGIDGIITSYVTRTLIFATQEMYDGFEDLPNDGWERAQNFYDDVTKYDMVNLDQYAVIPGYTEHESNPLVPNQRAGVWRITLDSNNLISLVSVQQIELTQIVQVRYGAKYGGNKMLYSLDNIIDPQTVPPYAIVDPEPIRSLPQTTFDSDTTRFLNAIDMYKLPEDGDKYLRFPKIGVFS